MVSFLGDGISMVDAGLLIGFARFIEMRGVVHSELILPEYARLLYK